MTLTTFSTPLDFPAMAALIQNQLDADQHQRQHRRPGLRPPSPRRTAAARSSGTSRPAGCAVTWTATSTSSTRPAPRPDSLQHVVPRLQEQADVAARRQRPDHARPEEAAADVPEAEPGPDDRAARGAARLGLEVPGGEQRSCRTCTSRSRTSTPASVGLARLEGACGGAARRAAPPRFCIACIGSSSNGSLSMIATLFAMSVVIFLLVRLLPGNIIDIMFGGDATATPEAKARRAHQLGLDGSYLSAVLALDQRDLPRRHGHLAPEQPRRSRTRCATALPITIELIVLGLLIAVADRRFRSASSPPCGATASSDYVVARRRPRSASASRTSGSRRCCSIFTSRVFHWVPPLSYVSLFDDP